MAFFKWTGNGNTLIPRMWAALSHRRQIDDVFATGDGSTTKFGSFHDTDESKRLYLTVKLYDADNSGNSEQLKAGTVRVLYTIGGVEYETRDDSSGNFMTTSSTPAISSAGHLSSGQIDYDTGELELDFDTAPDDGTKLKAIYEITRDTDSNGNPYDYEEVDGVMNLSMWELAQGDGSTTGFSGLTLKLRNLALPSSPADGDTVSTKKFVFWESGSRIEAYLIYKSADSAWHLTDDGTNDYGTVDIHDDPSDSDTYGTIDLSFGTAPDENTTISIIVDTVDESTDTSSVYAVLLFYDGTDEKYLLLDMSNSYHLSGSTRYYAEAFLFVYGSSYDLANGKMPSGANGVRSGYDVAITGGAAIGSSKILAICGGDTGAITMYFWVQTKGDYAKQTDGTFSAIRPYDFSIYAKYTNVTDRESFGGLEMITNKFYDDGQTNILLFGFQNNIDTDNYNYKYSNVKTSRLPSSLAADSAYYHPDIGSVGAERKNCSSEFDADGMDFVFDVRKSVADGKIYLYFPIVFNDPDSNANTTPVSYETLILRVRNSNSNFGDEDEILTTMESGKNIRHLVKFCAVPSATGMTGMAIKMAVRIG